MDKDSMDANSIAMATAAGSAPTSGSAVVANNNNNNGSGHMNGVLNNNNNNNSMTPVTTFKQCSGCGIQIVDRFLLHAMDRFWHTGCLKCSCCQAPLGEIGTTCFTKAGMILCRNDYIR